MRPNLPIAAGTVLSTGTACLLISLALSSQCVAGEPAAAASALSADTIVQRLVAANARRSQALRGYQGKRDYKVSYHSFLSNRDAEMQVQVSYTAPDKKIFSVVSETGSKLLINHVLVKLLDSEKEALQQQNRKQSELSPRNYEFRLVDTEHSANGDQYVLSVKPRVASKFLYNGEIWVDARDFAVVKMEGEPAKNPSFWISRTRIEYQFEKIGEFWFPEHTKSETRVRMGGKALLTIEYTDYEITSAGKTRTARGSPDLPDPSSVTPEQR
ncbi:MAG: hypothetical protein NVS9B5_25650 [Terriglobales bacterium]